jgi:hypothetical protein
MFTYSHKIPIQAFYTSAPSLSCQITLFLITEQNKVGTRSLLESASEREQCLSNLILSSLSLPESAFYNDIAVVCLPTASRTFSSAIKWMGFCVWAVDRVQHPFLLANR